MQQLQLEKVRRLALEEAFVFSQYMSDFQLAPMHQEWQEAISANPYCVIVSPKDHRKTTSISVERTLYELGKNRNIRIKIISHSDGLACDILEEVKGHIVKEGGRYHDIFPDITAEGATSWSRSQITLQRDRVSKDSTIEACGVLSSATGGKADLLIFDDVVSFKNAILNPSMRPQVIDAVLGNWMDIKSGPNARILYVATPWHRDDCTARLQKTPRFKVFKYAIDADFNPVWEERWPKEALMEEYRTRGAMYFNPAFRGQVVTDFDKVFNRDFLRKCCVPRSELPKNLDELPKFTGVDLAIGQTKSAKYTVIYTLAYDEENKLRYPIDIRRAKLSSPDTAREILAVAEELSPEMFVVENNFYQQALIEWLEDLSGIELPIEPFTTGANQKKSLDFGIPSMATDFQNERWMIGVDEGEFDWSLDKGCGCSTCVWLEEMLDYPYGTFTDTVIGGYLAREGSRKWAGEGAANAGFAQWEIGRPY